MSQLQRGDVISRYARVYGVESRRGLDSLSAKHTVAMGELFAGHERDSDDVSILPSYDGDPVVHALDWGVLTFTACDKLMR